MYVGEVCWSNLFCMLVITYNFIHFHQHHSALGAVYWFKFFISIHVPVCIHLQVQHTCFTHILHQYQNSQYQNKVLSDHLSILTKLKDPTKNEFYRFWLKLWSLNGKSVISVRLQSLSVELERKDAFSSTLPLTTDVFISMYRVAYKQFFK